MDASDRKLQLLARHGQNDPAIAIGRKNWLFAGSLGVGQRAAAVMSQIHSAWLNGHDLYAYLKDVLQRLHTHENHLIAKVLPHRWQLLNAWSLFGLVDHTKMCLQRAYVASS